MSSTTRDKRIRRIERRSSPEILDAMRKGLISLRTADSLFYLAAEEQRVQLQRRLQAASNGRIDFGELQLAIRQALGAPV